MDKLKAAFLGRTIRRDSIYEDLVISETFIISKVEIFGTDAVSFRSAADRSVIFYESDNLGNMLLALLNGDTVTISETPEESMNCKTLTLLPS